MSVTVQQILGLLQTLAPPELACSWDNVGLLVDADTPVSRVLTTLDITATVVQEAAENDCQLIVSHHPVIFDPLKRIGAGGRTGAAAQKQHLGHLHAHQSGCNPRRCQ